MNKYKNKIFISIVLLILYNIYFYIVSKYIIELNIFININNITMNNVITKFIGDFCIMLLFPVILVVVYRKNLSSFGIRFLNTLILYILIAIMIILFLLHTDFSINGFYKIFFYLVVIAFAEEFIYRGYVYNTLKIKSRLLAIIVSGFFWGIMHAILPGILNGNDIQQIVLGSLSQVGGGILMGYYFIYLQEKSKSLFIPILVHAILDYTIGFIGVFTAIGTAVYLFIQERRNIYLQKHFVNRF